MNTLKHRVFFWLILSCGISAGCWQSRELNTVEFEPHLEKPYEALEVYGVGFEGYEDPEVPGNFILLGWLRGASTATSDFGRFVYIGEPKIVIESKDGEQHTLRLRWMSEVPPREFSGRITIRVYNLEEGLIHWNPDPYGHWDYDESDEMRERADSSASPPAGS